MNQWLSILQNIGVFSIAAFFVQRIINSSADRKMADYKFIIDQQIVSYKAIYDQQIEDYRSQLKFLNDRLSSLHTERLEIIKKLHSLLIQLQSATYNLSTNRFILNRNEQEISKAEIELTEIFSKSIKEFQDYYEHNCIYFEKELIEGLRNIQTAFASYIYSKKIEKVFEDNNLKNEATYKSTKNLFLVAEREIPIAMETLQNEFRRLLGV